MTEDVKQWTLGDAIERELEASEVAWASRYRRKRSIEEARATLITMTLTQVVCKPGGRMTIHVQVQGKGVTQTEHYYNRYQKVPGSGYVRVYHRDG